MVSAHNTTDTTLSQSFVYLVSPRGGNNYWAVVINGCDKFYDTTLGTMAIFLSPNGRYTLVCDPNFFASKSDPMKKLILVHEAAHIALRHPERLCKLLTVVTNPEQRAAVLAIYNIAADFAVNDAIVRQEKEFAQMLQEKQFDGLLPEHFKFPTGKSMEEYMWMLVKQREEIKEMLKQMLGDEYSDGADEEGDGDGESDGEEGSDSPSTKTGSGGSKGSGKPGRRKKKGGQGSSREEQDMEEAVAEALRQSVADAIATSAQIDPDYYDNLKRAFEKHAGKTHEQWNEKADKMTPEEGISLSNKLKRHAKILVRSAHEQFVARGRGFMPNNIEKLVGALLAEEQVPWTWLFTDLVATSVAPKVIEEMACPNLMLINDNGVEPWPGFSLDQEFHIAWVTDTSGSMSDPEYARACVELNGLLKQNKNIRCRYMECDAAMQKELFVDNIQPPDDEELKKVRTRKGYGGTVYSPVFRRILGIDTPADWAKPENRPTEIPRRPDLVIIVTDGGVVIEGECFPQYHPGVPIIWLITPGNKPVPGMNNVPPDHVIQMFSMKEEE